jgi:hypothetical protein
MSSKSKSKSGERWSKQELALLKKSGRLNHGDVAKLVLEGRSAQSIRRMRQRLAIHQY